MIDIEFAVDQIPPEILPVIQAHVERYSWFIPKWVNNLTVRYYDASVDKDGEASGFTAMIHTEDGYRFAVLKVFGCWLECDERQRRYAFVHELCHLHFCKPDDFFLRTLDHVFPDEKDRGPGYRIAKEEYRRYAEGAVQDLAWIIINMEELLAEQMGAANVEMHLRWMIHSLKENSKKIITVKPTRGEVNLSESGRNKLKKDRDLQRRLKNEEPIRGGSKDVKGKAKASTPPANRKK